MRLFPEVPDAATNVMAALSLRDAFAARAAARMEAKIGSDALTRRRIIELPNLVQGLPHVRPPSCLTGVIHLILKKGITPVFGLEYDRSDELAAAVALSRQLPHVLRIDLQRIACTLLLSSRDCHAGKHVDLAPPVFPNCFVLDADIAHDAAAIKKEAKLWAQLSRSLMCTGPGLPRARHERNAFMVKISRGRTAMCAAVQGSATELVAHTVDDEDDFKRLIDDLRLVTQLKRLTLVVWRPNPRKGQGNADASQTTLEAKIREAIPCLRHIEEHCAERGKVASSRENAETRAETRSAHQLYPQAQLSAQSSHAHASQTRPQRRQLQGMHFPGLGRADAVWSYMAAHG